MEDGTLVVHPDRHQLQSLGGVAGSLKYIPCRLYLFGLVIEGIAGIFHAGILEIALEQSNADNVRYRTDGSETLYAVIVGKPGLRRRDTLTERSLGIIAGAVAYVNPEAVSLKIAERELSPRIAERSQIYVLYRNAGKVFFLYSVYRDELFCHGTLVLGAGKGDALITHPERLGNLFKGTHKLPVGLLELADEVRTAGELDIGIDFLDREILWRLPKDTAGSRRLRQIILQSQKLFRIVRAFHRCHRCHGVIES